MNKDDKKRRNEAENLTAYFKRFPNNIITPQKKNNVTLAQHEMTEGKINLKSRPYRIIIDPTNFCNLGCALCSTGNKGSNRSRGHMSLQQFKSIIDEIHDFTIEMFMTNWGESTLHKDILEMIGYASSKGIYTFLSTNFSLRYSDEFLIDLLKSGLGMLHIDIDGMTQEVYEKYRKKGSLELVLNNLHRVLSFRKSNESCQTKIRTSLIANLYNEHQIDDYLDFAKSLDLDEFSIDKLQIDPNSTESWLPLNSEYIYQSYQGKSNETTPCQRLWSEMTINWDGSVSACCVVDDKNADFSNFFSSELESKISLAEIWNSPHYQSARASFVDKNQSSIHTICHECKNNLGSPTLTRAGNNSFSIKLKNS